MGDGKEPDLMENLGGATARSRKKSIYLNPRSRAADSQVMRVREVG